MLSVTMEEERPVLKDLSLLKKYVDKLVRFEWNLKTQLTASRNIMKSLGEAVSGEQLMPNALVPLFKEYYSSEKEFHDFVSGFVLPSDAYMLSEEFVLHSIMRLMDIPDFGVRVNVKETPESWLQNFANIFFDGKPLDPDKEYLVHRSSSSTKVSTGPYGDRSGECVSVDNRNFPHNQIIDSALALYNLSKS